MHLHPHFKLCRNYWGGLHPKPEAATSPALRAYLTVPCWATLQCHWIPSLAAAGQGGSRCRSLAPTVALCSRRWHQGRRVLSSTPSSRTSWTEALACCPAAPPLQQPRACCGVFYRVDRGVANSQATKSLSLLMCSLWPHAADRASMACVSEEIDLF